VQRPARLPYLRTTHCRSSRARSRLPATERVPQSLPPRIRLYFSVSQFPPVRINAAEKNHVVLIFIFTVQNISQTRGESKGKLCTQRTYCIARCPPCFPRNTSVRFVRNRLSERHRPSSQLSPPASTRANCAFGFVRHRKQHQTIIVRSE